MGLQRLSVGEVDAFALPVLDRAERDAKVGSKGGLGRWSWWWFTHTKEGF
jgi:hypothetical protein